MIVWVESFPHDHKTRSLNKHTLTLLIHDIRCSTNWDITEFTHVFSSHGRPSSDRLIHRSDTGEEVFLFTCIHVWVRTLLFGHTGLSCDPNSKDVQSDDLSTVKKGKVKRACDVTHRQRVGRTVLCSRKQRWQSWYVSDNDVSKVKIMGHVSNPTFPRLPDTSLKLLYFYLIVDCKLNFIQNEKKELLLFWRSVRKKKSGLYFILEDVFYNVTTNCKD